MNTPHLPSPVTDSVNPGCSSPANQGFAAPPLGMLVAGTTSRGPVAQSNGENQFPSAPGAGVTATPGTVPTVHLNGDAGSFVDVRPADVAQVTGLGLPANVMADSQGAGRTEPPAIVRCAPVAVDVNAGSARPGKKLPANVFIR